MAACFASVAHNLVRLNIALPSLVRFARCRFLTRFSHFQLFDHDGVHAVSALLDSFTKQQPQQQSDSKRAPVQTQQPQTQPLDLDLNVQLQYIGKTHLGEHYTRPLLIAVHQQSEQCHRAALVDFLIAHKADPRVKDSLGFSMIDLQVRLFGFGLLFALLVLSVC